MIEMTRPFSKSDRNEMNFAMRLSFMVGIFMLLIKTYAYYITGSTAILTDAAESVIHIFAVGFAAYSMWLSLQPADANHLYGHEKVSFFSAGFEGAMIIVAALYIYFEAIQKLMYGVELHYIGTGILFIILATLINSLLAFYLIRKGKKFHSIILEANGKHILTDCLTSIAVIFALVLVKYTNMPMLDPIVAMIAASNILWTGTSLIKRSIHGLMDQTDPSLHMQITSLLKQEAEKRKLDFHHLRHRVSGHKVFIEFHLLFPDDIKLAKAHEIATEIESILHKELKREIEVSSHLETQGHHDDIHKKYGLPI